jgi:hypothetical protein
LPELDTVIKNFKHSDGYITESYCGFNHLLHD